MPTYPVASYNKSTRLFALYQRLPRTKDKAISLTELMNVYGNNPNHYANERKNLENDLTSLNQTPIFTKSPSKNFFRYLPCTYYEH